MVSRHTKISEEVHRFLSVFIAWHLYVMSTSTCHKTMQHTGELSEPEYTAKGLPGCIGSVNCIHIGGGRCPTQYTYLFTGKEGFASIAYKVICKSRKLIQSITVGHPGTRNDKHIVRTDATVTDLLYVMVGSIRKIGSVVVRTVKPERLEECTSFVTEATIAGRASFRHTRTTCQAAPPCVGPLL